MSIMGQFGNLLTGRYRSSKLETHVTSSNSVIGTEGTEKEVFYPMFVVPIENSIILNT